MREDNRSLLVYLNEERSDALLLLAWNHFGRKAAVRCHLTEIEEKGCVFDIAYGKTKSTETVSYIFPDGPLKDSSKISLTIGKLLERNSVANFPPGVIPYCVIILWIAALIGAANASDLLKYPFLSICQPYILAVLREQVYCTYLLFFLIFAHSIEGLHVAYLCNTINMPKGAIGSWVGMTFIIGYASYSRIIHLSGIVKKNKSRKNK